MSRLRAAVVSATTAAAITACGAPTAQLVSPDESTINFEVPTSFTDLGTEADRGLQEGVGIIFGLPDTTLDGIPGDPVFVATSVADGNAASYQTLRALATGGEFDPLDDTLDPLPNETELLGYAEINEPEVWGVRIRLATGRRASDFQAIVDRRTDRVTISEVFCTQACFLDQLELIDEIQRSWSLEP